MMKYIKKIGVVTLLLLSPLLLFTEDAKSKESSVGFNQGKIFLHIRLNRPFHVKFGREIAAGVAASFNYPELVIARRYGVTRINITNKQVIYQPLPRKIPGYMLNSVYSSKRNIWLGTVAGVVYQYNKKKKHWKKYRLANSGEVSFHRLGKSLAAITSIQGGGVYLFLEKQARFHKIISLPKSLPMKPLSVIRYGKWYYLGTDMGLFRFYARGRYKWELLGARDHLSKVLVSSCAAAGEFILLAGSKPQFARLPANIKLTSYGVFIYNYLQRRWERRGEFASPAYKAFLRINSKNISLPDSGLWVFAPKSDRAVRFTQKSFAFSKIIALGKNRYLAASRRGVHTVERDDKGFVAAKIAHFKEKWVDDIVSADGYVFILSGDSIFVSDLAAWGVSVDNSTQKRPNNKGLSRPFKLTPEEAKFLLELENYLNRSR